MNRYPLRLLAGLPIALLFACSDGLEPVRFQGVSGTVSFLGAAPESTDWVRLAVYRQVPDSIPDLFGFVAFSDALDLSGAATPYLLALEPGEYRWMPAIWKRRDAPLGPEALRLMGWYSGAQPFDPPLSFTVQAQRETAGIDIVADFETLLTIEQALEALP